MITDTLSLLFGSQSNIKVQRIKNTETDWETTYVKMEGKNGRNQLLTNNQLNLFTDH